MPKQPALSPDEILDAEFEYIANTAFQANEDRARVASFYLVTFGSFIAALVSAQLNVPAGQESWIVWGFAGLFLALALMGLVTVMQLARLRLAWFESVQAMNAIKEYYLAHFPDLEKAIKWRGQPGSLPNKLKLNSVGFMLVLQVAVLGGASLGAGVFFTVQALSGPVWFLPAIVSGLAYFLVLLEAYRFGLKK